MSYHMYLEVDTGSGHMVEVGEFWNYTSNCAPMWRLAGADLAGFDGKPAGECLPILDAAIIQMLRDPVRFGELNPPNGWGNYESLLTALEKLAADYRLHPRAIVRVSR